MTRVSLALSLLIAAALALTSVACDGGSGDRVDSDGTATASRATPAIAPAGPTTFSVIAGKADGGYDVEEFMPADIHVREGDSIEWTAQGIEGHTISFVDEDRLSQMFSEYLQPDPQDAEQVIFNPQIAYKAGEGTSYSGEGYFNSGFIGVPAEAKYRLTFTKKGLYQYICLVHPFTMRGTVSVDNPDAQVEAPESVAASGQAELGRYFDTAKQAVADANDSARAEPAPDGTSVHHVATGITTPYGQAAYFAPNDLQIKTGDTVIFENDDRNFHNVVFKGSRDDFPPGIALRPDPARGLNFALDKASAKQADPPPEGFGPETFMSSGSMGILQPRLTWRLRFDQPGTYVYRCTIHVLGGMGGVIEVGSR